MGLNRIGPLTRLLGFDSCRSLGGENQFLIQRETAGREWSLRSPRQDRDLVGPFYLLYDVGCEAQPYEVTTRVASACSLASAADEKIGLPCWKMHSLRSGSFYLRDLCRRSGVLLPSKCVIASHLHNSSSQSVDLARRGLGIHHLKHYKRPHVSRIGLYKAAQV